jgi:hypothetical protein
MSTLQATLQIPVAEKGFLLFLESRGSSGSIMSDYGLDDRGSIPDRVRGFFF